MDLATGLLTNRRVDLFQNDVTASHVGSRVLYCWQKEHYRVGILCVTGDSSTMSVSCCTVNCVNRFQKGSGIGFYVFPVDSEKK